MRSYLFLILFALLSVNVAAQGFITLDWENPSPIYDGDILLETEYPGFAEAYHFPENHLPYYITQIEVGKEYADYEYEVKIEYPDFQDLDKPYVEALIKDKVLLASYPRVNVNLSVSAKKGILNINFIPLVYRQGKYQRINSFKLSIEKKTVRNKVASRAAEEIQYAASSVLSSGKWVKIRVSESGIHQITHSELRSMGFSEPSKVRLYGYGGYILPEDVTLPKIDDLQEVPLWRENSFVLFYANGTIRWEREKNKYVHIQNHYSSYGYYFLTESDQTPIAFPKESSLSENGATPVTTFLDYALYEVESYSWHEFGRKLYDSYDYRNGAERTYNFTLPGITDEPGTIDVAFSTDGSSSSSVSVSVNGESQGSFSIGTLGTYSIAAESSREFTWEGSKSRNTQVTLTHTRSSGVSGRLDYIRLNFTRELALYDSYTVFHARDSLKSRFVISGANSTTRVWNVADPANYRELEGSLSGSSYTVITDTSVDNKYVVLNTQGSSFNKVEVVGQVANQNLHALRSVDMVILTPSNTELITQAERLATYHRDVDGLRVEVVTAEQVYNEFSSGTPDATAYRWFMKMLYDCAGTSEEDTPKYLLLFGDASYDNRMLTTNWKSYNPSDFLLCYPSLNSFSEVNSYVLEDYFGFLDSKNVDLDHQRIPVDIGIGRCPVRTGTQAQQVVDKMIAYMENKEGGSWKNTVCFLGDDGTSGDSSSARPNGANIHMEQSDNLATYMENNHAEFLVKRIFWDAYKVEKTSVGNRYPDVSKQMMEYFNNGMLLMNYIGHGSASYLSHEACITMDHISQIHSSRPALWITAACDVTPFDHSKESFGEVAFLHPTGAAIALLTTTRTVYSSNNFTLNTNFIENLFTKENNTYLRLGDVMRKTKVHMTGSLPSINNLHFVLIGNPAMKLSYADYEVIVEEFNGQSVDVNELPTIKAGGVVEVKGKIVDSHGQLAENFKGVVYPTVLDTKEQITTFNNTGFSRDPFTFTDRNKVLFTGSNIIEDGKFSFTFPVPLDINYSNESGLLNLYAIAEDNKKQEANGYFADFLIGGTEDGANVTDSLGPKINLYLNHPDFVYGGKVNETPYLIAELEDEDGINTVGNGIGHDIIAIIDNSPNYTYILNNYYESDLGNYTRGTVTYSLPELPEGKHELLFRAWDIKNNSSTATLEFEVVKGLKPGLFDLYCTVSPAKTSTTFIFSHDRPESELDVRISVYDFSGRELWIHEEKGASADNYYRIEWDLATSSGQRLSPGVYLYRASISSGNSRESTKARKIVILAQ